MPTLTQIRQEAAQLIGPFLSSTATSGSTTSQLEDTAWPVFSSLSQASLFQDGWIYRPAAVAAADKSRIVSTYTPGSGLMLPDKTWTNAPYSGSGEAYEWHGLIEPSVSWTAIINDALKVMMIPVEFTFTPTALYSRTSMTVPAPWLTEPDWVLQIGWLAAGELVAPLSREVIEPHWTRLRAQTDGASVYIEHGSIWNGTETCYVRALKPAYYHVAPSGGILYGTQSGMALEGDSVPLTCRTEWCAWEAILKGWARYSAMLAAADKIKASQQEAKDWADYYNPHYGKSQKRDKPIAKQFGPRGNGSYGLTDATYGPRY